MKKHRKTIVVEKTPPGAYNPGRRISDLVRNQILHLSVAERSLEKRHRSPLNVHDIETEWQASEYIHHLTKKLHARAAESKPAKKSKARSGKSARKSRKAKGKL